MLHSKTVKILRSLSDEELKEFSRFVISPYFNRLKDVTRLFAILKTHHPEYKEESVDKNKVFKKLFPSKPYNDERMRNLVSDLGQLAEKYLSVKCMIESDNIYKDSLYQNTLLDRRLYDLFIKAHKRASGNEDSEFGSHFKRYLMAIQKKDYFLYTGLQHKSVEVSYEMYDLIVGFYLGAMVKGLYEFKVHKNMHDYEKSHSLLKVFASCFDFKRFVANPAISENTDHAFIYIQYYLYELLTGENFEENLDRLLKIASESEEKMTQQEKYDIYLNLNNLLAFKIYEDGFDYSHLRMKILKETIIKRAYFHNKTNQVMPAIFYFTAVNLAIKLNHTGFIEFMLDTLIHITPLENRQSLTYYTKAQLEFINGNFEQSFGYISKVDYEIISLRKHVKNLTMMLYYELGYNDSALSLVSSYRQYLKRTGGFSGMYGPWYENFMKFYSELMELKLRGVSDENTRDINSLKTRLNNTVKVLFKPWLQKKMELLNT